MVFTEVVLSGNNRIWYTIPGKLTNYYFHAIITMCIQNVALSQSECS